MKIYFACSNVRDVLYHLDDLSRTLVAYPTLTDKMMKSLPIRDFFLDSGAFSVFSGQTVVNLDEYIFFIQKYNFQIYAALDVIGDCEASHYNYLYMRNRGIRPIPAIHYGQPLTHMDYYLDDTEYIAVGGIAHLKWGNKKAMPFLDQVFNRIGKLYQQSRPLAKVHGFGITTKTLMEKYPFYTVDSSSWKLHAAYGMLTTSSGRSISSPRSSRFNPSKHKTHLNPVFYDRGQLMRKQIRELLTLQKNITDLWTIRGITWD